MTIQARFGATPLLLAAAIGSACCPLAWGQAKPAQTRPLPMQANAGAAERVTTSVLPTAPCGRVEVAPVVQVSAGKSTVLRPTVPITRVLLGNPDGSRAARPMLSAGKDEKNGGVGGMAEDKSRPGVAEVDVLLLSPTEVYVLGKAIGSTNVVLLDERGQCTAFDVVVNMDTTALQTVIGQLLPNETDVRVSAAFDSVVLTGKVSDAGAIIRVMDLANAYVRGAGGGTGGSVVGANPRIVNMLATGAPQQVMLEVKVAEVSKALLDRFGIDFSRAWIPGDGSMVRFLSGIFGGAAAVFGQIGGTGPNGVPLSSVGTVVGGTVPIAGASGGNVTVNYDSSTGVPTYTTSYGTVPGRSVSNGAANMQKTDGLVKVLAEPTVMAISGQKGSFNAGGKIFIPVAQDSGSGGRTVTLEEKEFGVSVAFLPTVLDGGRINLEVATEVSELNRDGVGISAPGVSGIAILPSFTSRRAKTTVQLVDGQSFAIGGLIKNNNTASVRAFPILGELPIIGALFRSTEFQTDKSELVFVITPRLVKPLPPGFALPTDNYVPPTRSDVHWHGRTEGKGPEPAKAEAAAPPAAAGAASAPADGFQVK